MIATVPQTIDEHVKRLAQKLGVAGCPVYVPVKPMAGARRSECFPNVDRVVSAHGGEKIHGWEIALLPNIWVEAEFHAIWQTPDGLLVDVTPSSIGTSRTLFLPDPARTYTGRSPANVHHCISDARAVSDYASLAALRMELTEACRAPGGTEIDLRGVDLDLYRAAAEAEPIMLQVVLRGSSRNQLCPCGSGDRFKHCHENSIRRLAAALADAVRGRGIRT